MSVRFNIRMFYTALRSREMCFIGNGGDPREDHIWNAHSRSREDARRGRTKVSCTV